MIVFVTWSFFFFAKVSKPSPRSRREYSRAADMQVATCASPHLDPINQTSFAKHLIPTFTKPTGRERPSRQVICSNHAAPLFTVQHLSHSSAWLLSAPHRIVSVLRLRDPHSRLKKALRSPLDSTWFPKAWHDSIPDNVDGARWGYLSWPCDDYDDDDKGKNETLSRSCSSAHSKFTCTCTHLEKPEQIFPLLCLFSFALAASAAGRKHLAGDVPTEKGFHCTVVAGMMMTISIRVRFEDAR